MPKRVLQGTVVSDKNLQTIVVKIVRRSKKYHAHDENKDFKVGDIVRIRECKAISKLKRWEVVGLAGENSAGGSVGAN